MERDRSDPPPGLDAAPRPLRAEVDATGALTAVDPAFAALLGADERLLLGRNVDDFAVGAGRRSIVRAAADAASDVGEIGPVDLWLSRGVPTPVACRFWVGRAAGPEPRFELSGHDLAALSLDHRLRALEAILLERIAAGDALTGVLAGIAQLLEWVLPGARASIGVADDDGIIRHRAPGAMPRELVRAFDEMAPTEHLAERGRAAHALDVVRDPGATDARLAEALADVDAAALWMMRVELPDTRSLAGIVAVLAPADLDPDGTAHHVVRSACDLAATAIDRTWAERRLAHQSLHDALTGLPNRTLLLDRIAQAIRRSRRPGQPPTAVMMIDLDHFRVANDALGHAAGDRMVQRAASVLAAEVGPDETVGRFGGDEFVVVSPVADHDAAVARADELRRALEVPVDLGSVTVRASASIGVVLAGSLADARALIRDADAALHRAKDLGRNRVVAFDSSMRESVLARVELETALRGAMAANELEVHYQPIVELDGFGVVGLEALVRWRRSRREVVSPADFVPLAEDAGLIEELGLDVLDQAAHTAASLRATGWPDLVVSVNVSAHQLSDELVGQVQSVLASAGLDPGGLCLEITEGVLTRAGADAVVRAIADLGVGVAIDDFGTGFASLEYLRRFPVATVLKIDGSFVAELEGPGPAGQAIVAAASVLGHTLGMEVVAEGVETVGQLQLLRELGCDRGQGFLVGRPAAAADLPAALAQVVSPGEPH